MIFNGDTHSSLFAAVFKGRTKKTHVHSTKSMSQSEAEEVYNRLIQRPNIFGVILVNSDRVPIKSNIANTAESARYAAMTTALSEKARHCIRDLDPTNDLTFLRIRSKKNEIMVAPERDFTLVVIQKVTDIPRE